MQLGNQGREAHLFSWQECIVSGLACKSIICFKGLIKLLPPLTEVTRGSDEAVWFHCNGSVFWHCGLTAKKYSQTQSNGLYWVSLLLFYPVFLNNSAVKALTKLNSKKSGSINRNFIVKEIIIHGNPSKTHRDIWPLWLRETTPRLIYVAEIQVKLFKEFQEKWQAIH